MIFRCWLLFKNIKTSSVKWDCQELLRIPWWLWGLYYLGSGVYQWNMPEMAMQKYLHLFFFIILGNRCSFFYSEVLAQCFWTNRNVMIYFENKHRVLSLYKVMKVVVKSPSVALFQFLSICWKWTVVIISWRLKIHTLKSSVQHACFSCIHNKERNFVPLQEGRTLRTVSGIWNIIVNLVLIWYFISWQPQEIA